MKKQAACSMGAPGLGTLTPAKAVHSLYCVCFVSSFPTRCHVTTCGHRQAHGRRHPSVIAGGQLEGGQSLTLTGQAVGLAAMRAHQALDGWLPFVVGCT